MRFMMVFPVLIYGLIRINVIMLRWTIRIRMEMGMGRLGKIMGSISMEDMQLQYRGSYYGEKLWI